MIKVRLTFVQLVEHFGRSVARMHLYLAPEGLVTYLVLIRDEGSPETTFLYEISDPPTEADYLAVPINAAMITSGDLVVQKVEELEIGGAGLQFPPRP